MDEFDEEREMRLAYCNLSHAKDHLIGMLEALEDSNRLKFLEHFEEMAAALDINLDLDKIDDELHAL